MQLGFKAAAPGGPPARPDSQFGNSLPFPSAWPQAVAEDDEPRRWLANTPLLEYEHPKIRVLATRLTQLKSTPRLKALAIFQYIRTLPFGAASDSTGTSALTVLKRGMGDCHTKGTLMVALLRSAGIPARLRFVTMKPDFLYGILDTSGSAIEHAYTEVFVEDRWQGIDSYVVDVKLAIAAKRQLRREGRRLGYGMHADGDVTWNGSSDSFGQFTTGDAQSMPLHDWGAFDDPYQFYSSTPYVKSRLGWAMRMKWLVGAKLVNRKVLALRANLGA